MSDTIYAEARRWLFGAALPFWAEHGIDRTHGGFIEELRLDGSDAAAPCKRTRVMARQLYVLSHAALLGLDDGIALARHGFAYLVERAWLGAADGWARVLHRNGRVQDPTADLCDIAFVLHALGWYYRASGDCEVLDWIGRTADFIDGELRHPGGSGFINQRPATLPRLQSPHMHLLEAALVNLEATGQRRFARLADELVELFCSRFFDPANGTLAEHFTDDWRRLPGDAGRIVEPGHQFEWAWLLSSYQRATGNDVRRYVAPLVAFAEAHGVDPATGVTFSAVRDDGIVLDASSRIRCSAERIQAAVATLELFGRDPAPVFEASGRLLLRRHLAHTPRGTWIERLGPGGEPRAERIPASTLYHLMISFTEMLRVEPATAALAPTSDAAGVGALTLG